jgi:hypothetical protein
MKKKILLFISFLLILILTTIIFIFLQNKNEPQIKFIKSNDQISSQKISSNELIDIEDPHHHDDIGHKKHEKQTEPKRKQNITTLNGRIVVGKLPKDLSKLDYINTPNEEWQKLLGEELLRFQTDKTEVIVKPLKSLIQIKGKKARYVEKVYINYIMPNKIRNSYNAFVDSETGLIIQTWNRSIHHLPTKKIDL